jgi:hypothetical protein
MLSGGLQTKFTAKLFKKGNYKSINEANEVLP